jgi:glycosyltransferase involved in cell wall biosynthesis
MDLPVISVILPVYNGGSYLRQSLASVLSQSLTNFELLIMDDCSTDNSLNYLESLNDSRITVIKNEKNQGLFKNLNQLVQLSKAPLVKLWAQDDIMFVDCLNEFVNFHALHPNIGFSYSKVIVIDENAEILHGEQKDETPEVVPFKTHLKIACFTGSIAGNIANVCLNKAAFLKTSLFREDMKISGDFDMWVKLSKLSDIGFIKKPLIKLRAHKGQLSRQEEYYILHVKEDVEVYNNLLYGLNKAEKSEALKMLRKYKFVFYYTLLTKSLFKGNIRLAKQYYQALAPFTSFLPQMFITVKAKLFGIKQPNLLS